MKIIEQYNQNRKIPKEDNFSQVRLTIQSKWDIEDDVYNSSRRVK